jgi:hypothetical protein
LLSGEQGGEQLLWMSASDVECWGLARYPFEYESNFEKSEPCLIKQWKGESLGSQSAWRIEFEKDGYRAFQRVTEDNEREMELNLFCSEQNPGTLFLAMSITGPDASIRKIVKEVSLQAPPLKYLGASFGFRETGEGRTQVILTIPPKDVPTFLQKVNYLKFTVHLLPPFTDMVATTYLSNSRKALRFAANNCSKKDTP